LGHLRDRLGLTPGLARVPAPGLRARFVHVEVEDSTSGEDTDGEGGVGVGEEEAMGWGGDGEGEEEEQEGEEAEEVQEEEEDEEEAEAAVEAEEEPHDQHAHAPGASLKGGCAVRHPGLPPGALSEPGSPQARLREPGRLADNAFRQLQQEEGAGDVPELVIRGDAHRASSARLQGVSWNKKENKWVARCNGNYLGNHTTEEAAARVYSKYLEDGSVPGPVERGGWGTSRFKGVSWDKKNMKWKAQSTKKHLGNHATEEEAVRAYSKYLKDGIDPVKRRDARTSQFTGVCWDKNNKKWEAKCMGRYLGYHTTEEAAMQAYNVEAERVGRPLNIIPPAGAAGVGAGAGTGAGVGAGPKRNAPKSPAAHATTKMIKLCDASAGAAGANGVTAAQ